MPTLLTDCNRKGETMRDDEFTRSYVEAAFWSSTDDDGHPLDGLGLDLAPEAEAKMTADCERFQREHWDRITGGNGPSRAGHDFWLTRNHHGAGFWDGDWPEPDATILTDAAHAFGECDLYVGDDGLVYLAAITTTTGRERP